MSEMIAGHDRLELGTPPSICVMLGASTLAYTSDSHLCGSLFRSMGRLA
ncbi:hypothetical protein AB0M57_14200 [Streptomyces sp. NPDC051597]